ncbi:MAG: hypothetical protein ABL986_08925 [Vicinamibacterales bacterium]
MNLVAGMVIAFVLTFVFRFTSAGFGNDHFTHLSRARQILGGAWPIRDFFDPGQLLHYYLSAAAQLVFGYNLYGEALLTISFMSLGAALTFGVSTRLSRSQAVAACVTLAAVVAFPRLYNYPKVFLYVGAIWLAWWYAHGDADSTAGRPSLRRIVVLSAWSVLAFLFRYDHGAYVGGLMLVLLTLVHAGRARQWRRAMAIYAGVCGLLLLPFLLYVQWADGLFHYLVASGAAARLVGNGTRRALGVGIATPAPSFALAWLTGVTYALPVLTLLTTWWAWTRGRIARQEAAAVVAMACLCLVITRTLVDDDPGARLADVATPTAALGAWLVGRWLSDLRTAGAGTTWRLAARLPVATVFLVTLWSVTTLARTVNTLLDAEFDKGPRAALAHITATYRRLHLRPIDQWAPPGESRGIQALARYVMRCTLPEDRLLVAGQFAPEVFFYAEREFAGGQVHFMLGWHESDADQRLTVARLSGERVPIVLMGDQEAAFRRRFQLVAGDIDARYVEVPFAFNDEPRWRVLVERGRRPSGTDAALGLPCYGPV